MLKIVYQPLEGRLVGGRLVEGCGRCRYLIEIFILPSACFNSMNFDRLFKLCFFISKIGGSENNNCFIEVLWGLNEATVSWHKVNTESMLLLTHYKQNGYNSSWSMSLSIKKSFPFQKPKKDLYRSEYQFWCLISIPCSWQSCLSLKIFFK